MDAPLSGKLTEPGADKVVRWFSKSKIVNKSRTRTIVRKNKVSSREYKIGERGPVADRIRHM